MYLGMYSMGSMDFLEFYILGHSLLAFVPHPTGVRSIVLLASITAALTKPGSDLILLLFLPVPREVFYVLSDSHCNLFSCCIRQKFAFFLYKSYLPEVLILHLEVTVMLPVNMVNKVISGQMRAPLPVFFWKVSIVPCCVDFCKR